jgi:hypothetical protein
MDRLFMGLLQVVFGEEPPIATSSSATSAVPSGGFLADQQRFSDGGETTTRYRPPKGEQGLLEIAWGSVRNCGADTAASAFV